MASSEFVESILKIFTITGLEKVFDIRATLAEVPTVANPDTCRNPIDNFVRARLNTEMLPPSPRADRVTVDTRPRPDTFYGVGELGGIYTLNTKTGAATLVLSPPER